MKGLAAILLSFGILTGCGKNNEPTASDMLFAIQKEYDEKTRGIYESVKESPSAIALLEQSFPRLASVEKHQCEKAPIVNGWFCSISVSYNVPSVGVNTEKTEGLFVKEADDSWKIYSNPATR